jgi:pimeloyl-ACP methyl ester carboxylesterase
MIRSIRLYALCMVSMLLASTLFAQSRLKPGFDPAEYNTLLKITARVGDTPWTKIKVTPPENCRMVYRSPEVGMVNRWDLWLDEKNNIGIISIRGTNGTEASWMENFYAGMIAAKGTVHLNDTTIFNYTFSNDPHAYVHAGWTLGMAALAPDIISKIKTYYQQGVREFIIIGHSQGGAIAFLLRSYLQYLDDPALPKDIVYKTYCSAAPKPGNLFYAYDFDYITRNGWAFRVVNSRDWVPETPFSIQTTRDFNKVSPFMDVKKILKKQPFAARVALGYVYGRLDRSTKRASRRMQRILGKMAYERVKKIVPGYQRPAFVESHDYMTAGSPVILLADAEYDQKFPFDGKNIFINHMPAPYEWLLHKIYGISDK